MKEAKFYLRVWKFDHTYRSGIRKAFDAWKNHEESPSIAGDMLCGIGQDILLDHYLKTYIMR